MRSKEPNCNLHQVSESNLINLNGNMLCAIEVITTGSQPRKDSIIQICVLPLNANFEPHRTINPFYTDVRLMRPDKVDWDNLPSGINKDRIVKSHHEGIHPFDVRDRLIEWFDRIKFKRDKKVSILCHNWCSKIEFMRDLLGHNTYNDIFDWRTRDLVSACLYANDRADFNVEQIKYPKVNIAHIFSQLGVEHASREHDALQNCTSYAEAYKRMMKELY